MGTSPSKEDQERLKRQQEERIEKVRRDKERREQEARKKREKELEERRERERKEKQRKEQEARKKREREEQQRKEREVRRIWEMQERERREIESATQKIKLIGFRALDMINKPFSTDEEVCGGMMILAAYLETGDATTATAFVSKGGLPIVLRHATSSNLEKVKLCFSVLKAWQDHFEGNWLQTLHVHNVSLYSIMNSCLSGTWASRVGFLSFLGMSMATPNKEQSAAIIGEGIIAPVVDLLLATDSSDVQLVSISSALLLLILQFDEDDTYASAMAPQRLIPALFRFLEVNRGSASNVELDVARNLLLGFMSVSTDGGVKVSHSELLPSNWSEIWFHGMSNRLQNARHDLEQVGSIMKYISLAILWWAARQQPDPTIGETLTPLLLVMMNAKEGLPDLCHQLVLPLVLQTCILQPEFLASKQFDKLLGEGLGDLLRRVLQRDPKTALETLGMCISNEAMQQFCLQQDVWSCLVTVPKKHLTGTIGIFSYLCFAEAKTSRRALAMFIDTFISPDKYSDEIIAHGQKIFAFLVESPPSDQADNALTAVAWFDILSQGFRAADGHTHLATCYLFGLILRRKNVKERLETDGQVLERYVAFAVKLCLAHLNQLTSAPKSPRPLMYALDCLSCLSFEREEVQEQIQRLLEPTAIRALIDMFTAEEDILTPFFPLFHELRMFFVLVIVHRRKPTASRFFDIFGKEDIMAKMIPDVKRRVARDSPEVFPLCEFIWQLCPSRSQLPEASYNEMMMTIVKEILPRSSYHGFGILSVSAPFVEDSVLAQLIKENSAELFSSPSATNSRTLQAVLFGHIIRRTQQGDSQQQLREVCDENNIELMESALWRFVEQPFDDDLNLSWDKYQVENVLRLFLTSPLSLLNAVALWVVNHCFAMDNQERIASRPHLLAGNLDSLLVALTESVYPINSMLSGEAIIRVCCPDLLVPFSSTVSALLRNYDSVVSSLEHDDADTAEPARAEQQSMKGVSDFTPSTTYDLGASSSTSHMALAVRKESVNSLAIFNSFSPFSRTPSICSFCQLRRGKTDLPFDSEESACSCLSFLSEVRQARSLRQQGRYEEAIQLLQEVVALQGIRIDFKMDRNEGEKRREKGKPDEHNKEPEPAADGNKAVNSEFADELTQNYDRVAETVPSFRRLKELAKAITLARWLHSRGLAFDEDALWRAASDNFIRDTTKHEDLVPTLVKKYSYDNRTLTLTGGVSLYKKDTPYLSSQSPLPFEIEEARKALDTAEALAKPVTLQGEGGKRQLSAVWLPLPLAAASKDDRRAENAFENTQKLFESGKYADALRELKENVYPDSRRGMALLMAAWCACAATKVANNGVSDEAVRYLREASAHCGQDTKESETLRALTLEFAERFNNQAKQSLQKAKGVYTEGSKSLYYKNAIEAFLQAHSLLPTKREYLSNLSYAYLEIGDWDKAAQYAYWCTHVASEWPKGYIRLGNCLASSGSLHAAYGWYLEAEKRCQLPQELKEVRALCEELRRKIGQLAQEEEQDVTGGEGANTSLNLEVAGLKFTLPSTWQPSAVDTSSGKDSGVLFSFTGDNVAEPTFYFEKKRGPMPAASTDLRRGCEATATKGDKLVGDRQVRQIAGSARSCHITMMNCTAAFDWPTRKLVGQIPLSSAEYLEITFTVHKDLADYGLGIWERVLDSITAA